MHNALKYECCWAPVLWLCRSCEQWCVQMALQFYEVAWAGKLELMDELIAEEHAQRDMIWQACLRSSSFCCTVKRIEAGAAF